MAKILLATQLFGIFRDVTCHIKINNRSEITSPRQLDFSDIRKYQIFILKYTNIRTWKKFISVLHLSYFLFPVQKYDVFPRYGSFSYHYCHFIGIFLRFSNHLVKSDCLFMQETNCGHAEVNRQDRRKHIVIGFGK